MFPRPPNEPKDAINGFALDCMSQFKLGYYFVVQAIHDRRYQLVDAERGVVWAHVVFDQGTVKLGHSFRRPSVQIPRSSSQSVQHSGYGSVPD